ncbi:hypothetical protein [Saccharopolyspora taberi]|uniref:Uncharacterized protein n=1 Tax=Saccharopolyspora taberi TaxID=60895 RepID=A0ABN3VNI6_9PSEU
MNPIQIDALLSEKPSRDRTARAAIDAEVDRALREGGRLRPEWLDRFARWWASAVRELKPGAAVDPGPVAVRGCLR